MMKCNNCGKKIRIDARFCSNCGAQIDWTKENYDAAPEEVKETRSKKASKWLAIGVTAAIGIAAVFTIAIIGNAIHKNITAEPTEVASESSSENETETTTATEPGTTEPATTERRRTEPETTEPETTQPRETAPSRSDDSRSRERSRDYDPYGDTGSRNDSDPDRYYGYNDDYDYDENYADGWRRATDDYEGNGVADDIWDYLRTRGNELQDSYEYGQRSVYDSLEALSNQLF